MTTFNTGNPIGSTDARDRSDNSENLDFAVNSLALTFEDRIGVTRDTLEGVYQKSAYYRAGTFDAGYTLTNNRQTLAYGNIEYSWSGVFPKVVSAASTPETSGGVGAGAWVDRTQDTLRSDLAATSGAYYVTDSVWTFDSVSQMKTSLAPTGRQLKTVARYNDWYGQRTPCGGANYLVVTRSQYDAIRGNTSGPTALKNGGDGTNEWIDIELANGNIAVFQHDGMIRVSQAGARGSTTDELNPVDDTLPLRAVYAWAGSASSPLLHSYKSPMSGKTHHVHFEQGYYRADDVDLFASVYTSGEMVGSYAGVLLMPFSLGKSFFNLRHDDDGISTAPVFDGIRVRSRSTYTAGTYLINQPSGEFPNGANSVYFYRCWFQSAGGGDALIKQRKGDDWKYHSCTFDGTFSTEKWIEFGDSATPTDVSTNTKMIGCTYYNPLTTGFSMLNASGLSITGGNYYGASADTLISDRTNYQSNSGVVISGLSCDNAKTLAKIGRDGWTIGSITATDVQSSVYGLIYLDKSGTLQDVNIIGINAGTEADIPLIKSNAGCTLENAVITGNNLRTTAAGATSAAIDVSASTGLLNNFGGNTSKGYAKTLSAYRHATNGANIFQVASSVNPGSIAANTTYTLAVTVTGAFPGDQITLSYPSASFPIPAGIYPTAYVSAADNVTLVYRNQTSSPISVSAHDVNIGIKAR